MYFLVEIFKTPGLPELPGLPANFRVLGFRLFLKKLAGNPGNPGDTLELKGGDKEKVLRTSCNKEDKED